MGIDSIDDIHRIRGIRRLGAKILKQLSEFHDPKTYLTFNKRTKKYIMKRWKN